MLYHTIPYYTIRLLYSCCELRKSKAFMAPPAPRGSRVALVGSRGHSMLLYYVIVYCIVVYYMFPYAILFYAPLFYSTHSRALPSAPGPADAATYRAKCGRRGARRDDDVM